MLQTQAEVLRWYWRKLRILVVEMSCWWPRKHASLVRRPAGCCSLRLRMFVLRQLSVLPRI